LAIKFTSPKTHQLKSLQVLIITSSHKSLNSGSSETGICLQELADPYYVFKDSGECITISSPGGGKVPIDLNNDTIDIITESSIRFAKDDAALYHISHTLPINEIDADNFDIVFITGGYGGMPDLLNNAFLNSLLQKFIEENKPIGAAGSAVAALLSVKNEDGSDYIKGKKLTAYSNDEVAIKGVAGETPFMLESQLLSQGAFYSRSKNRESHVIIDDNLITGQNPASSKGIAKALLALAHEAEELYDSVF
jgi:putative intracellular protease/amidase